MLPDGDGKREWKEIEDEDSRPVRGLLLSL